MGWRAVANVFCSVQLFMCLQSYFSIIIVIYFCIYFKSFFIFRYVSMIFNEKTHWNPTECTYTFELLPPTRMTTTINGIDHVHVCVRHTNKLNNIVSFRTNIHLYNTCCTIENEWIHWVIATKVVSSCIIQASTVHRKRYEMLINDWWK